MILLFITYPVYLFLCSHKSYVIKCILLILCKELRIYKAVHCSWHIIILFPLKIAHFVSLYVLLSTFFNITIKIYAMFCNIYLNEATRGTLQTEQGLFLENKGPTYFSLKSLHKILCCEFLLGTQSFNSWYRVPLGLCQIYALDLLTKL